MVASLCGAHVTLTDKEEYPECLENCRQSCQANGRDFVKVVGITWGQFTANLFKLVKVDIILGSDCFYDTKGNFTTSLCMQREMVCNEKSSKLYLSTYLPKCLMTKGAF